MKDRPTTVVGGARYLVRFAVTALLLISATLVLVLYVLPERYVLSSGFRESGMSFPASMTPFVPAPVVRMVARDIPQPPLVILPGPAEIFWEELTPLLRSQRYDEALQVFGDYLEQHPDDRDARREYAITLLAAGRSQEAVPELRRLLDDEEDFERRLLLARTLRELGRVDEASDEYAILVEARPGEETLWLEWAQALAWAEEYDAAADVLHDALARHPGSVPLLVELARVEFSRDEPEAAAAALAGLDDRTLAALDALALRDQVLLAIPTAEVTEEPPQPTLLEQAVAARERDDFDTAAQLFQAALRERPDDAEIWLAYANLLEYELGDFEGARRALLEVERLTEADAALQLRLASLEIWMQRNDDARARLLALLALVESDAEAARAVSPAEVQAMLGDLSRWDGDRLAAARRYEQALASDPSNMRASDGLAQLQADARRDIAEVEQPGVGGSSYALGDSDDFSRVDLGGEWVQVDDDWAWGGVAGHRWLDGRGYSDLPAEPLQGLFVDLEAARWWRWATVRSGLRFGAERVRERWDYSVGASLGHRAADGAQSEVLLEHAPAYPTTVTLQSAAVGVVQDHVAVSHARPLSERWALSLVVDGALLRADLDTLPTATNETTSRLQGTVSLERAMSQSVRLGFSTSALSYLSPGPVVTDTVSSVEQRLFWDPRASISFGPFARMEHDLSESWKLTGRLAPGVAAVDERSSSGWDVIPQLSADAGMRWEGSRLWTALDLFYYQGRFEGYRMYGARLTVSARDWTRLGGGQ